MTTAKSNGGTPTIAPLKNVGLCLKGLERSINRNENLPGIIVLYGPSGDGKTFAATYAANRYDAVFIEAKSCWTRKAVLINIASELGIPTKQSVYELQDKVAGKLATSGRPLIVDEADHVYARGAIEIIRDIYESSKAPVLLIGEERLPEKLQQPEYDRFHGRVLDWVGTLPADIEDARTLAKFYAPRVRLEDDLLHALTEAARGSCRRICVNLALVDEWGAPRGDKGLSLSAWADANMHFFTGVAPVRARRVFQ